MQDKYEQPIRCLDEIVEACLNDGMKLPFHAALVSINGSSLVVRYVEGRNSRERAILADHMEGETFAPRTNVMGTDARGVSQWQRFDERWQAPGDDEAPLH